MFIAALFRQPQTGCHCFDIRWHPLTVLQRVNGQTMWYVHGTLPSDEKDHAIDPTAWINLKADANFKRYILCDSIYVVFVK